MEFEMTNPPGASAYAAPLTQTLGQRLHQRLGAGYQPRTEHLENGLPLFTNRLMLENAPYLLQHAHNPVDWYPWGEEAFARAKQENKPIFLSIGYATCHWCHVMERESFENLAIAKFLNEHFISIKVDREQHPAVDTVYMTAVMIIGKHGGWPMSSFLTPEGKTFFGGTYFPPRNFMELLKNVAQLWQDQERELRDQAEEIFQSVESITTARGKAATLKDSVVDRASQFIAGQHDELQGGFGTTPKFPNEPWLYLLLDRVARDDDAAARKALNITLRAMAHGGIHDQIGGGFHRYATDPAWLIPHFEKMLYNQAHLARIYTQAWRIFQDPLYARTARRMLDYVAREMTAPEGGFYSATDADSEGREGAFFVWTPAQIEAVLGEADGKRVIQTFRVTSGGNFEGHTILHLAEGWEALDRDRETLWQALDPLLEKLRKAREQRLHPLRDDKVLTGWSAMMITAFAEAAMAFDEPRYREIARKAGDFLWREQYQKPPFQRVWLDGHRTVPANLEDYACFAESLIALYDATREVSWLRRAGEVTDAMLENFWDTENGGFFLNPASDDLLLLRPKAPSDDASPGAGAVALRAVAQLSRRVGGMESEAEKPAYFAYQSRAEAWLTTHAGNITEQPPSFAYALKALGELRHGETQSHGFGANGALFVHRQADHLRLHLAKGWHINAHQPLSADLIPTTIVQPKNAQVRYPEPQTETLGFQDQPLAVYGGDFIIQVQAGGPIALRFQACNEQTCLPPETLILYP